MVTMVVDGRCKKWSDVSLYLDSVFAATKTGRALLAPPPAVGIFPCVTELVL
jgi:hypothetical protein